MKIYKIVLYETLVFSLSLLTLMGSDFRSLKDIEITPNALPKISHDGFAIGLEDKQKACANWIGECIDANQIEDITSELRPGFEKTLFGQQLVKTLITHSNDNYYALPLMAYAVRLLAQNDEPLIISRSRVYFDTHTAISRLVDKMGRLVNDPDLLSSLPNDRGRITPFLAERLSDKISTVKENPQSQALQSSVTVLQAD